MNAFEMAGTETDEVYTSELPRLTDVITKTVSPVCLSSEKAADGSESLVDGIGLDVTTAHKLYMILANLDPTIKLAIFPTTISPEDSKTRVKAWEHVLSSAQVRAGLIQFSASVLTVEEAETDGEKTQKNLLDKATHFFNEQAKPVEKEPSPTPTPSSRRARCRLRPARDPVRLEARARRRSQEIRARAACGDQRSLRALSICLPCLAATRVRLRTCPSAMPSR